MDIWGMKQLITHPHKTQTLTCLPVLQELLSPAHQKTELQHWLVEVNLCFHKYWLGWYHPQNLAQETFDHQVRDLWWSRVNLGWRCHIRADSSPVSPLPAVKHWSDYLLKHPSLSWSSKFEATSLSSHCLMLRDHKVTYAHSSLENHDRLPESRNLILPSCQCEQEYTMNGLGTYIGIYLFVPCWLQFLKYPATYMLAREKVSARVACMCQRSRGKICLQRESQQNSADKPGTPSYCKKNFYEKKSHNNKHTNISESVTKVFTFTTVEPN